MTRRDLMSNGVYSETPIFTAQIFPSQYSALQQNTSLEHACNTVISANNFNVQSEPEYVPIKESSDNETNRKQGNTTPVCHSDGK